MVQRRNSQSHQSTSLWGRMELSISTISSQRKSDPSGNLTVIDRNLAIAPNALSLDRSGTLYFAVGNTVKKYIPNGVPQLVAGPGTAGVPGDNGPSLQGNFFVSGLASDADGNIYIADGQNNRVRKFAPGGNITTVAGNRKAGFSGDGGPAQQAQLNGRYRTGYPASIPWRSMIAGICTSRNQPKTVCGRSAFRRLLQCLKSRRAASRMPPVTAPCLRLESCSAFSAQTWLPQQPALPVCRCR